MPDLASPDIAVPLPPGAHAPAPVHDVASAVAALEEDIVLNRLHPRERLTEDELMQRFGLKRHAVRDVLAELTRLGLAERRKNVGAEVRSFTVREVMELYAVRELLETEAARQVPCPPAPEDLQRLIDVQRQHDAAVAAEDPRAVFRTNLAFHQTLFGLCENLVLQKAIQEYARQTHSIRFSTLVSADYRSRARHEHWQMIEALRQGQREVLVALCREHITPSRDGYLAANRHLQEG
ncbi:Transcriptional regulator, GntR family [plant metagenome]|uniref:Transcriptional regulator, GntR family n=2 Tax=root TaxID=1 RepID=A0A1C3K4Y0_9BURK|nr:GntR family transcriptional regulator [Orrella dioscoreae]SBT26504.1 Transcriptional regulator, GntR family [Orrella dioscoreae]SOE46812.1 Transcriptional regulator, GntR family [Orrella dioscoreae]